MDKQFFSEETTALLNDPIAKEAVKTREGTGGQKLSYIASHHAIEEANRLFGFGMWGTEIQHIQMVDKTQYVKKPYNAGGQDKPMISVSYTCHLKLTVRNGIEATSHEDMGFGNGVAGDTAYGLASVIELASKEAVTDALKRCLRYYGNKFGLSLYDKDSGELMTSEELESTKPITDTQLNDLRALYEDRGIDDSWVIAALAGDNHTVSKLEELNQSWFHHAYTTTYNYKLKEIESVKYKEDVKIAIGLMRQSVNLNMLQGLFKEAWTKATDLDDNETKLEAQKVYNEMKAEFEK